MNLFEGVWNPQELYPHLISAKIQDLSLSAKYGFTWLVKYLIPRFNDRDKRALRESAQFGQLDSIKILLEAGANIHVANEDSLEQAIRYNQFEVVQYLVQQGANIRAKEFLYIAVDTSNGEMFKYLIDTGLSLEDNMLDYATDFVEPRMIEFLLKIKSWSQETLNDSLGSAIFLGKIEIAKMLLESGAEIESRSSLSF